MFATVRRRLLQTARAVRTVGTIRARRLALLGLLALPALSGCGAGGLPTASIADAAGATVAERGMRVAFTQTLTLPGAGRMSSSGYGVMDTARQISHLTLKVTSKPDVVVGAFDNSDHATEVITDRGVVFTRSPQLGQLLGAGRKWVKIDVADVGRAAGFDVSALTQSGQDPTQAVRQLEAVGADVETIAREDVRGVRTTRYRATVDLRRYADLVAPAERAAAREAIDHLVDELGGREIPVDVWIGPDGLVRRLAQMLPLEAPGGPAQIAQRFEFYDFGTKVDVKPPDADEVVDVSDLIEVGGAATIGP